MAGVKIVETSAHIFEGADDFVCNLTCLALWLSRPRPFAGSEEVTIGKQDRSCCKAARGCLRNTSASTFDSATVGVFRTSPFTRLLPQAPRECEVI